MQSWEQDELLDWDALFDIDDDALLLEICLILSEQIFLSNDDFAPYMMEAYQIGYVGPEKWWPLVLQLDTMVDLESIVIILDQVDELLALPGLPSALLEDPLAFLFVALDGNLPKEPSGRRVGSPKLVKLAKVVIRLEKELPATAQAAVATWANMHRGTKTPFPHELLDSSITDLLLDPALPTAISGFSMLLALTLMNWPERAEGLLMPPELLDPALYDEIIDRWETMPDSPSVTGEGAGEAEALFAQAQIAHLLAQTGTVELVGADELDQEDETLTYSRLSRAILWVHNQCRHCPERKDLGCLAATNWPERPVPLLDISGEIANTNHIAGCIKMQKEDV